MKKRYRLFYLVFIILLMFTLSQACIAENNSYSDNYEILIKLVDISDNQDIKDVILKYDINDIPFSAYTKDGELLLRLAKGNYKIKIEAQKKTTVAYDYYGETSLEIKDNQTTSIYLYPVGFIRGIVKDNLDNIVPNAKLKFNCVSDVITQYPEKTDEFGFFKVEHAPVSSCKIFASYKDAVGVQEVVIQQGSLNEITINLDKSLLKDDIPINIFTIILLFIIIFLFIIAIGFIGFKAFKWKRNQFKGNRHKKEDINAGKNSEKSKKVKKGRITDKTGRMEAILVTLNKKEKAVIEHILNSKESIDNNYSVSQANIRHSTNIPRTSLSRVLQSLEAKKIINIEKHGKMVKISLTDFFLGNE
ncbi:MAG: hypothetical protein ABIG89_05150 [Candidatus Woesearchaeota archaeon]